MHAFGACTCCRRLAKRTSGWRKKGKKKKEIKKNTALQKRSSWQTVLPINGAKYSLFKLYLPTNNAKDENKIMAKQWKNTLRANGSSERKK